MTHRGNETKGPATVGGRYNGQVKLWSYGLVGILVKPWVPMIVVIAIIEL
jgi:hypothetical protein